MCGDIRYIVRFNSNGEIIEKMPVESQPNCLKKIAELEQRIAAMEGIIKTVPWGTTDHNLREKIWPYS